MPEESKLAVLREQWLRGAGLRELIEQDSDAAAICKELYGYQLPWIVHAISQNLQKTVEDERISAFSLIALLVEIGVPTELASKIFLSGIWSRAAATELARLDVSFGTSISAISRNLRNPGFVDALLPTVSQPTAAWLDLLIADEFRNRYSVPSFVPFKLKQLLDLDTLHSRTIGEELFLCSFDGREKIRVTSTERLRFDQVANDPRFVFIKSGETWHLSARDPRCV